MGLVPRLNQLAGNANALAIAAHASLENAVDMQLRSNFSNGFLRGLVLDGGSSRDHAQSLGVELSEMRDRSEEHTSELQSRLHLVCRLLLEKKKLASSRLSSSTLAARFFWILG